MPPSTCFRPVPTPRHSSPSSGTWLVGPDHRPPRQRQVDAGAQPATQAASRRTLRRTVQAASPGQRPIRADVRWRDSTASWKPATQIVVDGGEQFGWLRRTWLKWHCRRRGAGLLGHGASRFGAAPTVANRNDHGTGPTGGGSLAGREQRRMARPGTGRAFVRGAPRKPAGGVVRIVRPVRAAPHSRIIAIQVHVASGIVGRSGTPGTGRVISPDRLGGVGTGGSGKDWQMLDIFPSAPATAA